jgi:hypothetical protein
MKRFLKWMLNAVGVVVFFVMLTVLAGLWLTVEGEDAQIFEEAATLRSLPELGIGANLPQEPGIHLLKWGGPHKEIALVWMVEDEGFWNSKGYYIARKRDNPQSYRLIPIKRDFVKILDVREDGKEDGRWDFSDAVLLEQADGKQRWIHFDGMTFEDERPPNP